LEPTSHGREKTQAAGGETVPVSVRRRGWAAVLRTVGSDSGGAAGYREAPWERLGVYFARPRPSRLYERLTHDLGLKNRGAAAKSFVRTTYERRTNDFAFRTS